LPERRFGARKSEKITAFLVSCFFTVDNILLKWHFNYCIWQDLCLKQKGIILDFLTNNIFHVFRLVMKNKKQ